MKLLIKVGRAELFPLDRPRLKAGVVQESGTITQGEKPLTLAKNDKFEPGNGYPVLLD